jgi:hypothetical protein
MQARSILRIPRDAFVMLYLGRLTETYKADLDSLLTAFGRTAKNHGELWLLLAGQTPEPSYVAYLRKRLGAMNLLDRASILENFPEYVKSTILAASNVLVSPADSIQETFGLSILEAMAHAIPVIGSDWSGYRDLIVDGQTGVLVKTAWSIEAARSVSQFAPLMDPFEIAHRLSQGTVLDCDALEKAITHLIANPTIAEEMGRSGRRRVAEHFCWTHLARQYLDLWTEQLSTPPPAQRHACPMHEYWRFFGHYPSQDIGNDAALTAEEGNGALDFYTRANSMLSTHVQEAGALLRLCGHRPTSVNELRRAGYSLQAILWALKKGVCSLLPKPGDRRC